MNIFITGGIGYIGSHTCVRLIELGYNPIILDNCSNSKHSVLDRIAKITGKKPIFYHGDIRDPEILEQIFTKHNIDAVIHFAGLKAVGESSKIPLEYYNVNVQGSINLAQVMQKFNVFNLIFSSSATVYGDQETVPYVETMQTKEPASPYGKSKLMVEQILADLQKTNPTKWNITLLRYFNPVGAHPSGLIGEDPLGIPNNLMPYIAQVAIGKLEYLNVFGNDYPTKDGTGVRDYIHVMDLADGHILALEKNLNLPNLHIYNLGAGKGFSVLEMIKAFEQACGKNIPYKIVPRRAGDLSAYWADSTKAKNELNWETQKSIMDITKDTWNWQIKSTKELSLEKA